MTTYTIATTVPASDGLSMLLATVPDSGDIATPAERLIAEQWRGEDGAIEYEITTGLTLTDEEPEDEDRIVWRGHDLGWLIDETGRTWEYAVRVEG